MQEQTALYVADNEIDPRPAPPSELGFFATVRRNLFATPVDAILTIVLGVIAVYAIWGIFNWAFVDATFTGTGGDDCREGAHGACWAFVSSRFEQFMYGNYPIAERWRPNLVGIVLVVLLAGALIPRVPYKGLNVILLVGIFPLFALVMLTGGGFRFGGGFCAFVMMIGAGIAFLFSVEEAGGIEEPPVRIAFGLIVVALVLLFASNFLPSGIIRVLGLNFTWASMASAIASLGAAVALGYGRKVKGASFWVPLIPVLLGALITLLLTETYGLRPVSTTIWGGLMLTLVVAITGIAMSLPLGIILALGRQSTLPAIRWVCIAFIEFWRGVPLITVLFLAAFMLPLLVPAGVSFNQLLRALIGVALFSAAYMAEVIRGGLQAIPKGQYEGAKSLGLGYWAMMRLIILPQALKLVIPGIVNTFIGLFKDTSLVYIIGLADLLGTVTRGTRDPNWIAPSTAATGLVFAGFVFWLFCFGMSRYSQYVERRLDTGYKR